MKILSKKSYEKLQQCLTELQMDFTDTKEQLQIYDEQVVYLNEELRNCKDEVIKLSWELDDKNREIKRLKTLLTKNNIKYKKEDKNETRKKILQEE